MVTDQSDFSIFICIITMKIIMVKLKDYSQVINAKPVEYLPPLQLSLSQSVGLRLQALPFCHEVGWANTVCLEILD